ncbi:MAG: hypothetical protein JWQ71_1069 [Pedosphaera sp.]|nr:hypothetical protein [Pedosphaera sp.]
MVWQNRMIYGNETIQFCWILLFGYAMINVRSRWIVYRMTKSRSHDALIMAMLLLGVVVVYRCLFQEPAFRGKTLTYWLEKLDHETYMPSASHSNDPRIIGPIRAIKEIGTNGMPTLIKLLNSKDTIGTCSLESFVHWLGWRSFHITKASEKRSLACNGFEVLGKEGMPAVPRLIQLTKTGNEDVRLDALECLISIKPNKDIMLPVLTELFNQSDTELTREAAYWLSSLYPDEASKLSVFIKYPYYKQHLFAPPVKNQAMKN